MFALEIKNLSKNYGQLQAVKGVSFSVSEKEIFALIGPNGAGKSTTLKILSTLLVPTAGTVSVFNHDLIKEPNKVREVISYLPEEAGAYKNLSGMEYLEFMAALYSDNFKVRKKYVENGIGISGLNERLWDKIGTYSKGMTRKLLLARTVMTEPKLAILDEPTSGLDVVNALEIRKKIRELSNKGMSVLLSSHNMLEIDFLSDRVGIINQGRILEIGTPGELKSKYSAKNLEEVFAKLA